VKVTIIAGARPNFMKIAPIIRAIEELNKKSHVIQYRLVHTGQHYDEKLSRIFFEELHIPKPHINLEVGSGSQAEQTAKIMIAFEKELITNPADLVLVVGDVTSTMACTIVSKKLGIKVAHVEAGIRSFDMDMPEEINRIVTDSLADYFFTTTEIANENLKRVGADSANIFLVGNTMIDSLIFNLPKLKQPSVWNDYNLSPKGFYVMTLHRPSNVDDPKKLETIIKTIDQVLNIPIVFPVHPRTRKNLERMDGIKNIYMCEPLSYLEFIFLIKNTKGVITDSGGVQEETTYLHVPCITLRQNTERPETVSIGTNEIIGDDLNLLKKKIAEIESGGWKTGDIPQLWDGETSVRIVDTLKNLFSEEISNC